MTDAKTGLRRLHSVDLWEVSLVTFPMHPGARVTQVKRAELPERRRASIRSAPALAAIDGELTRLRWRRDALAVEHVLRESATAHDAITS